MREIHSCNGRHTLPREWTPNALLLDWQELRRWPGKTILLSTNNYSVISL